MTFKYSDVLTEAREMLHDENGTFNWSDDVMFLIAVDGAELIYKVLTKVNPSLFEQSQEIDLTVADGYGPYSLPNDFKYPISMLNSSNKSIDVTSREKEIPYVSSRSGEPQKYWFSGRNPVKAYFDRVPDKAYAFTLWYIPVFTRAAADTENVPLDDDVRSALRSWIEKIAGMIDEYNTMDEDKKIAILMPPISQEALMAANDIEFTMSGLRF